jgi:hypothetical protein
MSKLLYEGSKATFREDADMLEVTPTGLIDIGAD